MVNEKELLGRKNFSCILLQRCLGARELKGQRQINKRKDRLLFTFIQEFTKECDSKRQLELGLYAILIEEGAG